MPALGIHSFLAEVMASFMGKVAINNSLRTGSGVYVACAGIAVLLDRLPSGPVTLELWYFCAKHVMKRRRIALCNRMARQCLKHVDGVGAC